MSQELTRAEAKVYASSYVLLSLLQRMDQKEPGLIEELLAGARGDFEESKASAELPPAVLQIFEETIAFLECAGAHRLNSKTPLGGE